MIQRLAVLVVFVLLLALVLAQASALALVSLLAVLLLSALILALFLPSSVLLDLAVASKESKCRVDIALNVTMGNIVNLIAGFALIATRLAGRPGGGAQRHHLPFPVFPLAQRLDLPCSQPPARS
ncbi:MAG: hypothetical protein RL748_2665 [Pseudomonadota bacterium]|jgi:hypothetical protein